MRTAAIESREFVTGVLDKLVDGSPKAPEDIAISRYLMEQIANKGYVKSLLERRVKGRGRAKKVYGITQRGRRILYTSLKKKFGETEDLKNRILGDVANTKAKAKKTPVAKAKTDKVPARRGRPPKQKAA